MSILYEKFPEYVILNGKMKYIITDYRDWLKFYDMIRDENMTNTEKTVLISSYYLDDLSFSEMQNMLPPIVQFFRMDEEQEQRTDEGEGFEESSRKRTFCYSYDAKCIAADFYSSYGIDLLSERTKMHWWKFNTLLHGLPSETEFKQRCMYRNTDIGKIKDKNEKLRIKAIQKRIALPQPKPTVNDIGDMFW